MSAVAGYSGTPLPRKLGLAPGQRVHLAGAPAGFLDLLGELPPGVRLLRRAVAPLDLVVVFATARADLAPRLPALQAAIHPAGALWVAWPKKAARVPTDLTEDVVRELALPRGLVDVKVIAIDATWSGLKLVVRAELRG